jgi:hypothetical protein
MPITQKTKTEKNELDQPFLDSKRQNILQDHRELFDDSSGSPQENAQPAPSSKPGWNVNRHDK